MTKLWQKGYHLNEQVEHFEAAQIIFPRFRKLRQQVNHRRHQNCVIDPLVLDSLTERERVEAW